MPGDMRQPWRISSRLWPFSAREEIVTVVDFGAHKVASAILAIPPERPRSNSRGRDVKVLGSAVVASAGVSGGRIVNMAAAETCLRRAVAKAEAQAGVTAEDVVVAGQFPGLLAEIFGVKLGVENGYLIGEDVEAAISAADRHCSSHQRRMLHVFASPSSYAESEALPDGTSKIAETDLAVISIPIKGVRLIAACLRRSLLNPKSFIAGPIAAALAVTTAEERQRGALVLDIGAQSTGLALFLDGVPAFVDAIPAGGSRITEDIAKTFSLRKFEAEQIKIRHGSVFDGLQADIDLPFADGDTGEPISKFALNRLIRSHASSLFEAVNERLKGAGYSPLSSWAVLTGGGSMLPGMQELASHVLAADVRSGRTASLPGLRGSAALSALVGACIYACGHQSFNEMAAAPVTASHGSSYASRISQWLRTSF